MSPLVIDQVRKSYGPSSRRVLALDGVSLEVRHGQFQAIMGASGSGKSTLLHLMAGLATTDSGTVTVDGQNLAVLNDAALTRFRLKHIGLVFQSFNLIPTLSAEENVMLPLRLDRRITAEDTKRADELLALLGLASRKHHRPDAMSGGEQQRVAIGRALINDPAVVLADEPTGNLDSVNSRAVCELLRDLCTRLGKTIVMVTHEPTVAAYASDVAVLKDGRMVDQFETAGLADSLALAARYQTAIEKS
jgi:putative ABC transport system ATP-binding protein